MAYSGKIGFIGVGKMGGILVGGLVNSGMASKENILIYDADAARMKSVADEFGVTECGNLKELAAGVGILFSCVKPDQISNVSAVIADSVLAEKPCIVSIMAGVKKEKIRHLLNYDGAIVRVMPNVCCSVGKGVAGIACDEAAPEESQFVFDLFEALGGAVWVPESKMDIVTAMSGSGPAYVFIFIEAMADAGVKLGLDRKTSEKLAIRTVAGAAEMANSLNSNTLELRAMVTSPGGTTAAGTSTLESCGFRACIIEGVEAAYEKSVELGK